MQELHSWYPRNHTINRCQAGFERNSMAAAPVSLLLVHASSIMPAYLYISTKRKPAYSNILYLLFEVENLNPHASKKR